MMRKRWRNKKMQPNTLQMFYGKLKYNKPSLIYQNGDGCYRGDLRLLCELFEQIKVIGNSTIIQELESRGYDITTLEFSIKKKVSG